MAKLTDDERAALKALQEKEQADDAPAAAAHSTRLHTNVTIDLDNEAQVRRAVRPKQVGGSP